MANKPDCQPITPCLWFDGKALEAAEYYVSVFSDSGIDSINYYGKEGFEIHGHEAGTILTVSFHLRGMPYLALNGGPLFQFNESVSFQIFCDTQAEIDYYWNKLTDGGEAGQCGWLKDKFGLSWQVVPSVLPTLLSDSAKSEKTMKALMQMTKFDIESLVSSK